MNDADRTAITALREAAGALHVGDRAEGARGKLSAEGMPAVAGEVGQVLDAIVGLLRTVDLDPQPVSSEEHAMGRGRH